MLITFSLSTTLCEVGLASQKGLPLPLEVISCVMLHFQGDRIILQQLLKKLDLSFKKGLEKSGQQHLYLAPFHSL